MAQEETTQPKTRDEIIAWYKEQIEVAELRAILSKHQADAITDELRRLQALGYLAQMQHKDEGEDSGTDNKTSQGQS